MKLPSDTNRCSAVGRRNGAIALVAQVPVGETGAMRPHRNPRPCLAPRSAFTGYGFPPEDITLAVRWYLRFGLSYWDVEVLLSERGILVDHVSIYGWVQRFAKAARARQHVMGDRNERGKSLDWAEPQAAQEPASRQAILESWWGRTPESGVTLWGPRDPGDARRSCAEWTA
jgi:hypothetical protein